MGMKEECYNKFMASAFAKINKILKYIERSLDDDIFNTDSFNAQYFELSENRFARYLKMLLDADFINGVTVIDNGEPEEFEKKNYKRFKILVEEPTITFKGMQFLAENTLLIKSYKAIKEIKGFVSI